MTWGLLVLVGSTIDICLRVRGDDRIIDLIKRWMGTEKSDRFKIFSPSSTRHIGESGYFSSSFGFSYFESTFFVLGWATSQKSCLDQIRSFDGSG